MTLNTTFIDMADSLRTKYESNSKLSLSDMIKGINGLEVNNLINPDQVTSELSTGQIIPTQKLDLDWANLYLRGKLVVLSYDLELTEFNTDSSTRVGWEYHIIHKNGHEEYFGDWHEAIGLGIGKFHIVNSSWIDTSEIVDINEGCFYFQLNAKGKVSNFKMFTNPMGGGK